MENVKIDGFDIEFSRIGLGTWAIGGFLWGGTDKADSIAAIQYALDKGINVIDTAPVYGFGLSEQLIAQAIKNYIDRDRVIISTKAGLEWQRKMIFRNSTPERIYTEIDDSLKRLDCDYIDIYFVHWPDPLVPFEKTAEAMLNLYEAGKIRAIGVSNYNVEQMKTFAKAAPIHFLQPPYNLFEREIDTDILPYCLANDIKVFGYSSLCRGLLSGCMKPDREFEGDDIRKLDPKYKSPNFEKYLEAVASLNQYSKTKYGNTVMNLAIRWILDKGIDIALWGARKSLQLNTIDNIFGWNFDSVSLAEIEAIVSKQILQEIGTEFMGPGVRRT